MLIIRSKITGGLAQGVAGAGAGAGALTWSRPPPGTTLTRKAAAESRTSIHHTRISSVFNYTLAPVGAMVTGKTVVGTQEGAMRPRRGSVIYILGGGGVGVYFLPPKQFKWIII